MDSSGETIRYDIDDRLDLDTGLPAKTWAYLRRLGKEHATKIDDSNRRYIELLGEMRSEIEAIARILGLVMYELERSQKRQRKRRRNLEEHEYLFKWLAGKLASLDIEIDDPCGRWVSDESVSCCDVIASIGKKGIEKATVGETVEPVVRYKGKVISFGKIVCYTPDH